MSETPPAKQTVSVVGGGISGLLAARNLVNAGYQVEVLESAQRLGGKIQSTSLNGASVDLGAEFIDKPTQDDPGQQGMIKLCNDLGIKLKDATDQNNSDFSLSNGKAVSNGKMEKLLEPLQEKLRRDKANISSFPNGPRAREIQSMSMAQYLDSLVSEERAPEASGALARMGATLKKWLNKLNPWKTAPGISPEAIDVVKGAFTAEEGRTADKISAAQFIHEASLEKGNLIASNCGYRVEGGMETVIKALKADLEKKGVTFRMGTEVSGISKNADRFSLALKDGKTVESDKVVLATNAHALANINGLESLGLSSQSIEDLGKIQYTHSTKFSIATKGDGKDSCLFSGEGFQAWRSAPGVMTFLVGGEELNRMKGKELVQHCLDAYGKAQGKSADKLFDTSKVVYGGVDSNKPCYCSPAVGQTASLSRLSREFDALAENDIGIVGTFVPNSKMQYGFMENGVESAERITSIMQGKERGLEQQKWRDLAKSQQVSSPAVAMS